MGTRPSICAESGCALHQIGGGFSEVEVGSRYESTKLLLVGEASGEAEARESLPFRPHAQSGSLLADALREVNISRSEIAITNCLRCRPPKDWLEGAPWQYSAITHCTTNFLFRVIEDLKPRAILALGATAMRALTSQPKGKYGQLEIVRGYVAAGVGPAQGIPVIATMHPSWIRRGNAQATPLLQRDLRRAFLLATGRLVEGKHFAIDLGTLGLRYETSPSIDDAWHWFRNMSPNLPISHDCETPRSVREEEDERVNDFTNRDVNLFQATQRRGEGIALPWRDEFIDVAKAIMKTANLKIGHNSWTFDQPVLEGNGVEYRGDHDDTMVMYGSYWSDLPRNLQSCAQMAGFQFPWKHFNDLDQGFYGVADVDACLCVWEYMQKLLAGEQVA